MATCLKQNRFLNSHRRIFNIRGMELHKLNIAEASKGLDKKEFSPSDLFKSVFSRAKEINKKTNAYITLMEEEGSKMAKEADKRTASGERKGVLDGVPVALKDLLATAGTRTTAGSKILENYISSYDATVVAKLRESGAVFLGKTNMDEFAMGSSNENSYFGPVKNPWNLEMIPGGSSGGSAVATASDACIYALGSDTGGSIRQPASLCGVVGLKPTYGRVSRYGLFAMSSSLDQIGPFAKTVEDARLVYDAIKGRDSHDSTTVLPSEPKHKEFKKGSLKGMVLGVPKEYFIEGMDPGVEAAVRTAIGVCKDLGAEIKEVSLPISSYGLAVYYIIMPAEVSANLARYDGIRYGYSAKDAKNLLEVYLKSREDGLGAEVRRRIMMGAYVLSSGYYDAYYRKAQKVRTLVRADFLKVFQDVDALITPTSPSVAWKLGAKLADPLAMYLSDIYTVSANVAGIPAISLPCGFSNDMPVGLQIMGRHFDEETILHVAEAYEGATEWSSKRPNLN